MRREDKHGIILLCVLLGVLEISKSDATTNSTECFGRPSFLYSGTKSVTASGLTCQRWDEEMPHKPKHIPQDGGNHNYCRNPDDDTLGTWCHTVDPRIRWEHCNITKCPDDSLLISTYYDSETETASMMKVHADPEIVKKDTDTKGTFNMETIFSSNRSRSEFWALEADYHNKVLYFTDYKLEYLGKYNMETGVGERYLEGMTHGIEDIAYDPVAKNMYFTDSNFNWVMVTDNKFKYYTPVYRGVDNNNTPHGLAVHYVERLLFFSTYKSLGSQIIVSDLAGKNQKVLFKYPDVFDVTGMTIDYTDNRIYWTDFTGSGGMLISSRLNGSNKTQHHYEGGSIFWAVATNMDYIFISDVRRRYSGSQSSYRILILAKQSKQKLRYTMTGKPRGIAFYADNKPWNKTTSDAINECFGQSKCDHLCLPSLNSTIACACSLGYHLDPVTNQCQAKLIEDEFILLTDRSQGKVFQLPIGDITANDTQYSIVPLGHDRKIHNIAYDPASQFVYWSEEKTKTINRAKIDGSSFLKIADSFANSIVIDPQTGNVFYSDKENKTIVLSSGDGTKKKTIVRPEEDEVNTTSIRMVEINVKTKYIYWVDTFSKEGSGKLMRCRYDGSDKRTVLEGLNWPQALTIDYQSNRLYLVEAKTQMLSEIKLSNLEDTIPTQRLYDLSSMVLSRNSYLMDAKIKGDMAYVMDIKNSGLQRFNLTEAYRSLKDFGPREFYSLSNMALVTNTSKNFDIQSQNNLCKKLSCPSLCVQVSDVEAKCICEDGKSEIGKFCVDKSKDLSGILSDIASFVLEEFLKVFKGPRGK